MKVGDLVLMKRLGPNTPGAGYNGYGIVVDSGHDCPRDHNGQWIHVSWSECRGAVKRHFYKDVKVAK
jgi:hypothetical protein